VAKISRTLTLLALTCFTTSLSAEQRGSIPAATETPRIVFEQEVIDLGATRRGAVLELRYAFRNEGNGTLRLLELQSSCGCMVPSADRLVAPGEKGSIRVQITTDNLRGQVEKAILVRTNDPDRVQVRLTAKLEIETPITVEPAWVAHRVFKTDPPRPQIVTLSSRSGEFAVKSIATDNHLITAHLRDRRVAADGSVQIQLAVDIDRESAPLGALGGFVTVETTLSESPQVRFRVNGLVLGPVVVTPRKVYLSEVELHEAARVQRTIFVTKRNSIDLELRSVTSSDPGVLVQPQTVEDGHVYAILVTLDPDRIERGKISSTIVITTNDAFEPQVEVFVNGRIYQDPEAGAERR
jgi:hypothetical protein